MCLQIPTKPSCLCTCAYRDVLNQVVCVHVLAETYSEAVKILKGEYVVRAIEKHNMDRALIFCRTKLDCDNLERYLNEVGKGTCGHSVLVSSTPANQELLPTSLTHTPPLLSAYPLSLIHI